MEKQIKLRPRCKKNELYDASINGCIDDFYHLGYKFAKGVSQDNRGRYNQERMQLSYEQITNENLKEIAKNWATTMYGWSFYNEYGSDTIKRYLIYNETKDKDWSKKMDKAIDEWTNGYANYIENHTDLTVKKGN